MNTNAVVLVDIDECTLEIDSCEHSCVNTNGSYTCTCNEGYELDTDGLSCNGKPYKIYHLKFGNI